MTSHTTASLEAIARQAIKHRADGSEHDAPQWETIPPPVTPDMQAEMDSTSLIGWLRDQKWSDFAQSLAQAHQRYGSLTERQQAAAEKMRTEANARNEGNAPQPVVDPEPGFYVVDGIFYRVQFNRDETRVYGKMYRNEEKHWEYSGRKYFGLLTADNKVTVEDAAKFGHAHGVCLMCGRTLTDPASVAQGIGPVCITKIDGGIE